MLTCMPSVYPYLCMKLIYFAAVIVSACIYASSPLEQVTEIMVTYFRGSDSNLHAASLVGVKDSSSASVDTSSQSTVIGTVKEKSTENILLLDTSAGEMELKMDKVSSPVGCKVLVKGKKISVKGVHAQKRLANFCVHIIDRLGRPQTEVHRRRL